MTAYAWLQQWLHLRKAPQLDEREELFNLWLKHGTCVESDSSEGWELVDAILAAGYGKVDWMAAATDTSIEALIEQHKAAAWDECNATDTPWINPYRRETNG